MKVLIFGATGRLGAALRLRLTHAGYEVTALSHADCPVNNPHLTYSRIMRDQPEVVINATAKNGLEACMARVDQAIEVNTLAPAAMARAALELNALLIHYSTDYVFSGDRMGLAEDTPTNPCGVYGYTKLWGEQAVHQVGGRHYIFRLSSLYGTDLAGMLGPIKQVQEGKGASEDNPVKVLDQYCAPTSVFFVADATVEVLKSFEEAVAGPPPPYGVYHMATTEAVWKLDFTAEMLREVFGRDLIVRVGELAIPRPRLTQLLCSRLLDIFPTITPMTWREDLKGVLPFIPLDKYQVD